MPNEEEETIELKETFEKPRKKMSDKQLENLAKGRAARTKKVELSVEEKQNKRLEDRFDKLVAMFEKVQLPAPEVQEKVKARRAKPPPHARSRARFANSIFWRRRARARACVG